MIWKKTPPNNSPAASVTQDPSAGIPPSPDAAAKSTLREKDNGPSRRRSQRVYIVIRVCIFGQGHDKSLIYEDTSTLMVSAHGALITLTSAFQAGQTVILVHGQTGEEMECRIVSKSLPENGRSKVGLEFTKPCPRFWRMTFPPDDWNAAERKRPPLKRHP